MSSGTTRRDGRTSHPVGFGFGRTAGRMACLLRAGQKTPNAFQGLARLLELIYTQRNVLECMNNNTF